MPRPFSTTSKTIETTDREKRPNGSVEPLLNENEANTLPIEQVYITHCAPGCVKGPHVHLEPKHDRFYCIRGRCVLVCRDEETMNMYEWCLSEDDSVIVHCPPGVSHAIYSQHGASILSMPTEGYRNGKAYNQAETSYNEYDWSKWDD